MQKMLIVLALMLAMPLALAQEKGKTEQKKGAPALEKKADKASEKQAAQQARMKECNRQAGEKNLKGDERKKFMSQCLSK
jgi:uncharacterized protein YdeI (BOF family)